MSEIGKSDHNESSLVERLRDPMSACTEKYHVDSQIQALHDEAADRIEALERHLALAVSHLKYALGGDPNACLNAYNFVAHYEMNDL